MPKRFVMRALTLALRAVPLPEGEGYSAPSYEHLHSIHQTASSDVAAHAGAGHGWRTRLLLPPRGATAPGGVSDVECEHELARRESRHNGLRSDDAARAEFRPHRRNH